MEDETQTDETDATASEPPAEDAGAEGMEAVDADPGLIFDKLDAWLDGFFRLLPNIAVALVLLALFVGLGWLVAWAIRRGAAARDRQNLGSVGGSLVKWGIWIAGFLLAATIVVPTLRPGDIAQAHQPDEWIAVEQFEAGERFLRRAVETLAE